MSATPDLRTFARPVRRAIAEVRPILDAFTRPTAVVAERSPAPETGRAAWPTPIAVPPTASDVPFLPLRAYGAFLLANPGRKHLLVIRGDVPFVIRRVRAHDGTVAVAITIRDLPADIDEAGCASAFAEAAIRWLSGRSSSPAPEGDLSWFATRPERRHRIRPASPGEVEGRPDGRWATLVHRVGDDGRLLRLCLDEGTLPRGDRGEGGLAAILHARASALASGSVLGRAARPRPTTPSVSIPPRPALAPPPRSIEPAPTTVAVEPASNASPTPRPTPSMMPGAPPARALAWAPAPVVAIPVVATPAAPSQAVPPRPGADGFDEAVRRVHSGKWSERTVARTSAQVWPRLRLEASINLARSVLERHGRGPVRAHDARKICAVADGGDGGDGLAALRCFGLVKAGSDGMERLTPLAHDILDGAPDVAAAGRSKAAANPRIHGVLLAEVGAAPTVAAFSKAVPLQGIDKAEVAVLHERYLAAMAHLDG